MKKCMYLKQHLFHEFNIPNVVVAGVVGIVVKVLD